MARFFRLEPVALKDIKKGDRFLRISPYHDSPHDGHKIYVAREDAEFMNRKTVTGEEDWTVPTEERLTANQLAIRDLPDPEKFETGVDNSDVKN